MHIGHTYLFFIPQDVTSVALQFCMTRMEYKQGNENEIIQRTLVPIALYGCEAWTLKKAEEKQLILFEMAALRKILGIPIMDKMRNKNIRRAPNPRARLCEKCMRDNTNRLDI